MKADEKREGKGKGTLVKAGSEEKRQITKQIAILEGQGRAEGGCWRLRLEVWKHSKLFPPFFLTLSSFFAKSDMAKVRKEKKRKKKKKKFLTELCVDQK